MKPVIETILAADGTPVITARFTPAREPRGAVLIVHGFGEYHGGYFYLGEYFCKNGFAAVAFDQRGFGKNHKNSRGVLADYELFLDDITLMREKTGKWFPGKPVYLYGHSMGGNIAVSYILKRGGKNGGGFKKLILETPWFRLYKTYPWPAGLAARLIGKVSYKPAAPGKLVLENITHDRDVVNAMSNDGLYHNRLSFRIYTQIQDAGKFALASARKLTVPTLLFCADGDKIVSPQAIKEFARASGNNVLLHVEREGYHALHSDSEPVRGRVLKKMVKFLKD